MPTRTFTEGNDRFEVVTDEDWILFFLGGDDLLIQNQPEGAGSVRAEMGTGNDRAILYSGEYANLQGNDGNDAFDIRSTTHVSGIDILGGVGSDIFRVYNNTAGYMNFMGEEGADQFRLYAPADNITFNGGIGDDRMDGNNVGGSGTMVAGSGNDRMYGFTGGWTLQGGTGDDLYRANPLSTATFVENAGEGIDAVQVAIGADYVLPANIENISVQPFNVPGYTPDTLGGSGRATATLTGNDLDNRIVGSSFSDETMFGLAGNDMLIGNAGDDHMFGGTGNDTYYVDRDGDRTNENAGEGHDIVRLDLRTEVNETNATTTDDVATYQLQPNVEDLYMQFDIMHNVAGNALDNKIVGRDRDDEIGGRDGNDRLYGNAGDDILRGENGDDVLFGNEGNDTLRGGAGNDTLQGSTGDDNMRGEAGDDTYIVDSPGDTVGEAAGEGTDTVYVTHTGPYTLPNNVENLVGAGSSANLTGDDNANAITGTSGADVLDGQGGADTITGLGGADIILAGDDGTGFGDGAVDTFVYNAVSDSPLGGADSVREVTGGLGGDVFDLSGVDADETTVGDQAFTYIGEGPFTGTAGELRKDGDDIFGDTDGDGVADLHIIYDTGLGPDIDINNFIF